MPGFNRKGPLGEGPMTGRSLGRCGNKGKIPSNQDSQITETNNPDIPDSKWIPRRRGLGRGLNQGQRAGHGYRNRC